MKNGSLFDGSGGFPLAAYLCGGIPTWASEVEPYPIAVTKSRFPKMVHLGDVSKVKGDEVEPVDIITFGSPCQDLSVAGKRAGLKHEDNGDEETTRSGLFMEAIRIIKEMRKATNGIYPTFAIWENVPGAFSSNKGEDFRVVLEEFVKISEPSAEVPPIGKGGWPYADTIVGDGWSIAYRTFDAQYWGVPQRRRRIYLVADFRGERAAEILFKREGLRGYFEKGRTPWESIAAHVERGSGANDCYGVDCYNQSITGDKAKSLRTGTGPDNVPCVAESIPYTMKIRCGCEGGGKGALIQENKSATLATNNDQYLFQPVDEPVYAFEPGAARRLGGYVNENITGTLRAEMGDNQVAVAYAERAEDKIILVDSIGGKAERGWEGNVAPTLKACHYKSPPCIATAYGVQRQLSGVEVQEELAPTILAAAGESGNNKPLVAYMVENHPADSRVKIDESGTCQTLTSRMGTGGGNVPMVLEKEQYLFENHSQDTRYKGPLDVCPIISATFGMGGNNQPFVVEKQPTAIDVEMEVAVRKYEVDNKALCDLLRDHKKKTKISNSELAEKLDVPLTKVDHWFRQDKCFAIPDAEIWYKLKDLLGITTDEFDKAITEFEFRGGSYDMSNRIYTGDVSPTLTCGCEKYLHLVPVAYNGENITSPQNKANPQPGDPCHTLGTDSRNYLVYCLQGNGIDRADTAGCNGKGWREDASYTLNTIDRPAVVYGVETFHCNVEDNKSPILKARDYKDPHVVCYGLDRASFNQGENAQFNFSVLEEQAPTMIAKGPGAVAHPTEQPPVRYIVRRLTPTECARLQGFPDKWGHPDRKESLSDEEYKFWLEVRNTHAAINGKAVKEYSKERMLTYYNKLHTDSSEYKMWGNGIALPNALYIMQGIAEALQKQSLQKE